MKLSYYQDIVLRPGEDFPLSDLRRALYEKLHIRFADAKNSSGSEFALGFPGYSDKGVGSVFRVFATSIEDLVNLDIPHICMRSFGALDYKKVKPVPEVTEYVGYKRVHDEVPAEKRIAGIMKRYKNEDDRDAAIARTHEKRSPDLPFVWMTSCTTKKALGVSTPFPLYIEKTVETQQAEHFNTYGLTMTGEQGGVPLF